MGEHRSSQRVTGSRYASTDTVQRAHDLSLCARFFLVC